MTRTRSSLVPKQLFVGLEALRAHLCTGGEAPMLESTLAALQEFCSLKSRGMAGRAAIVGVSDETKELLAAFLGVTPGELAFLASASDGLNALARGIEWQPGDNVVSLAREYPSSLLPWLAAAPAGVELRAVEPGDDPEGAIADSLDDRTRVVCVSHVSYLNGLLLDLERLAGVVRSRGAILAVDASHSLGAIPIPIAACDVLVSCCYKFLLGVHGAGVFYLNRERLGELASRSVGWYSVVWPELDERARSYRLKDGAGRFELGNPSFISVFALREGLRTLSTVSRQESAAHIGALAGELAAGLVELGLPVTTPKAPRRRGSNIAFATREDGAFVEALAERGVLAWSGDGRVRFSLHVYNDSADVRSALDAVATLLRESRG